MRILLAEDEKALSKAIIKIFEKNNYSADAAYDGEEALVYLDSGCYDVAVLDIMMPKMDGITVLKELRAKGNQIPVLMLTAKSDIEDRVLGLDSGANDYLPKPFDTRELLARIRSITRSKTEADAKAKGKVIGRPQVTAQEIPQNFMRHYPSYKAKQLNISEFARVCDMSRTTVYKYLSLLES